MMKYNLDPYLDTTKYEHMNYIQCVGELAKLQNDVYEHFVSQTACMEDLFEIASLVKYMLLLPASTGA